MPEKYHITADVIERDLTSETPQWILSSYAPGRDAPGQLFGGYPREQSFEEMRLHFYTAKAAGTEQQALNDAQQLYGNAQQQMRNAVTNTKDAIQFIVGAEDSHPNRLDICQQGTQGAPFGEFLVGKRPKSLVPESNTAQSNPFGSNNAATPFGGGATAAQTGSAFGQPSALGQKPNPFGTPAFGQPSQPTSAFSQPATQGASAFGQPSQPTSAFGQPSQPTSAFGQPSALGAKPNPFGAPSQPNNPGSAFGQPSQLGQKSNPFAASANTNNTNVSPFSTAGNNTNNAGPFASAGPNNNAPAANPFGAPSGQNQGPSAFASNNQNQNVNGSGPFGQPSQTSSPFGQASAPAPSNPFASTNQGPSSTNNPFAQAQQPQQQTNGFASQPSQQQANPFGQPSNAAPAAQNAAKPSGNPYPPGSSKQHPPIESYSAKDMTGRLTMFNGKPVTYKDGKPGIRQFDGTWCRIWFPDGPPGYSRDTELPADQYDDKTKAQWIAFEKTGAFQDGIMPELPPLRECTLWNF